MIRTIFSIAIALMIIIGASFFDVWYVNKTFALFEEAVDSLYNKTEAKTATIEDGKAVQTFWLEKKRVLHVWIPHTCIQEIDYQLDEAAGCIYVRDYDSALPKLELVKGICRSVPHSYTITFPNIF